MPYNNLIARTGAQALIPEQVSNELLKGLTTESAAMTMFRTIRMATNQTRMPVLAALPTAYFVNGDTGLKQTTEVDWANKYLNVEELACIVPVPENVLDDVTYDLWGEITPLCQQAMGRAFDAAVFFGVNKPASWPTAIVAGAVAAGHTYLRGATSQANGGLAADLSLAFGGVETSGFDVNGIIATTAYKGMLRNARTTQGEQLIEVSPKEAYGVGIMYPMRGLWPTGSGAAEAVLGDFTQGILGIRKDISWKILDQAVIQDNTGAIVYNLAQQDMVAIRLTFRAAYQVANTLNYDQAVEANRYPFSVLHAA